MAFVDRQRKSREANRPAVNFTRRDDVRDLMKSPPGQNYSNMMDLQNQAIRQGGFEKGDPKVAELKAARRKYNREDKYNVGSLMGYNDPVEIQDIYRKNSGVLREYAKPTYKEMYPISNALHDVVGSGGLTGMLLNKAIGKSKKAGRNFFEDLRGMGADIFGGIGIGGAVPRDEATEEILTNYSDKTFGPINIHDDELWPYEDTEVIDETLEAPPEGAVDVTGEWVPPGRKEDIVDDITVEDRMPGSPFFPGNLVNLFKKDKVIPGHTTSYVDRFAPIEEEEIVEEVIPPTPFDDSNREAGIASLYGQGPRWASTNRRYEKEYRDYIMSSGDQIDYDDFERFYEKIYQGKPHALHSSYR